MGGIFLFLKCASKNWPEVCIVTSMNDVTTLLLNSIGAGNRGEGRGQEAATKQGNGQLFSELMMEQSTAKTTRPLKSEQTATESNFLSDNNPLNTETISARDARTDNEKDAGPKEGVETAATAENQHDNQTVAEQEALQPAPKDQIENSTTTSQNHNGKSFNNALQDNQNATTNDQEEIADSSPINNNLLLLLPFAATNNPVDDVAVNTSSDIANNNVMVGSGLNLSNPLMANAVDEPPNLSKTITTTVVNTADDLINPPGNVLAPALQLATTDCVAQSADSKINDQFFKHEGKNEGLNEDAEISLTNPNQINMVQSPLIVQNAEAPKQATTIPPQAGELAQQVTFAIRKGANEGTSQMHIKLNPVELGGIDIRIEVDADHHVRAILTIERPETYDLLHKDAQHLQKLLGESGLKLADSNAIQYEQRSSSLANNTNSSQDWLGSGWFGQEGGQAGRHAQNDSGYTAARHPGGEGDDAATTPVNLITYTHGQIDGRVNIRV
jgi:hypothetical protein